MIPLLENLQQFVQSKDLETVVDASWAISRLLHGLESLEPPKRSQGCPGVVSLKLCERLVGLLQSEG
jgi:hypothetical protein